MNVLSSIQVAAPGCIVEGTKNLADTLKLKEQVTLVFSSFFDSDLFAEDPCRAIYTELYNSMQELIDTCALAHATPAYN